MWQEFLLVSLLAPCAAVAIAWLLWLLVRLLDDLRLHYQAYSFRRRIMKSAPISSFDEDQLAQRIWESQWLLKHTRCKGSLTRPVVESYFLALIEQYQVEQLSREAYELWRRATLDGHFPHGLLVQE